MARFNFYEDLSLDFNSPQEMYTDYKKKKIKGVLDYQSELIDNYMSKGLQKKDVALELPTGSGKTLVGLLIGEYRRRKDDMKVVYVCPNKQLVNQVAEKAKNEYGIEVASFTGNRSNYEPENINSYISGKKIAITNYSSIFNVNSFFNDPDLLIFDDAHSSDSYISKNWTINISKMKYPELFLSLLACLKRVMDKTSYLRLTEEVPSSSGSDNWNDLLPMIKQNIIHDEMYQILSTRTASTELKYPWSNLKDKLKVCNIYLSKGEIVIRPYIPPTLEHEPFKNAKQRLYMSATLGNSGELERTVGVSKIERISLEKSSVPSIGRRLFIFPNAKFHNKENYEIFSRIKRETSRGLILAESNNQVVNIMNHINSNNPEIQIYGAQELEKSIKDFETNDNAVAVLANRYDGLDLQDDACHFLLMYGLPSTTHLQEKFFLYRLSTSVLYDERLKTRITQATGRCTRSTNDYAVVMITGMELEKLLIPKDKQRLYDPELRAEIEVGHRVSEQAKDIDDLIEIAKLGLEQTEDWSEIDTQIIKKRNLYKKETEQNLVYKELLESAKLEVKYQYQIWRNDYDGAIATIERIINGLRERELGGYRQYWNYTMGSIYSLMHLESENTIYLDKANEYYDKASKFSSTITWFRTLKKLSVEEENDHDLEDLGVSGVIDRIELYLSKIKSNKRLQLIEKEAVSIIDLLKSDGIKFEEGLKKFGEFLGYESGNSDGKGAPDPWWILDKNLCIVSENKIYANNDKSIPLIHIREAAGHPNWIKTNLSTLTEDATIINVFITNSTSIDDDAIVQANNIYYLNRDEYIEFARKAIAGVSEIMRKYTSEGILSWRLYAKDELIQSKITPRDYLEYVKSKEIKKLNNLY